MSFSVSILEMFLRDSYPLHYPVRNSLKKTVNCIQLFNTDQEIQKDTLYINVNSTPLKADLYSGLVINILPPGMSSLPLEDYYYILAPLQETFNIINKIFYIFDRYQSWLISITSYNKDSAKDYIEHALEETATFIKSSVCILDYNFSSRLSAHGLKKNIGEEDIGLVKKTMVEANWDNLYENWDSLYIDNPLFDQTYQTDGLQRYSIYDIDDILFFYINLKFEGRFIGRFNIQTPQFMEGAGFSQIISELYNLIIDSYRQYYLQKINENNKSDLSKLLSMLMNDEHCDQKELNRELASIGWLNEHHYQLLKIVPLPLRSKVTELQFIKHDAEYNFSNCIAITRKDSVMCIINTSIPASSAYEEVLPVFLRDFCCKAGISSVFQNISEISMYIPQTNLALELGSLKDPHYWYYYFKDYAILCVFQKILEVFPADSIANHHIFTLKKYDDEHPGMECIKTLAEYLKANGHVVHTADKLFIHRTTVMYRLNKIKEMTNLDLNDWYVRFDLLLSLQLTYPEFFEETKALIH